MTQGDLAQAVGMTQNNISRLESMDYGKHTISSLKRIAEALDVALVVRFVPFSQYINWLSGTPHLDRGLSPESLAVPGFQEEEKVGNFEYQTSWSRTFAPSIKQVVPSTTQDATTSSFDLKYEISTTVSAA